MSKMIHGKAKTAGGTRENVTIPQGGELRPVGPVAVERVLLVTLNHRPDDHQFVSRSLPGHLLQLMISGRTWHEASGRGYSLGPGSLIWYHQDELVRGRVVEPPWSFYSLNFIAPSLAPPAFEHRVRQVGRRVRALFGRLHETWRDTSRPAHVREMLVQAGVLEMLAAVVGDTRPTGYAVDPSSHLWWQIETWLREDLSREVTMRGLTSIFHKSEATIARSAHAAVGMPPMKRLKVIRMSLAAGLVQRSGLLFKQIATQVGYERLHEFSRDYRKHHGVSPRAHRQGR